MIQRLDESIALGFLAFILVLVAVYRRRVHRRGTAHFERTDGLGGAVLKQGVVEMGYWWMQPCARFLIRCGFTANGISWTALGLGAAVGILISQGLFGFATVLATAAAFMDTLDGLVARLTNTMSQAGEVLDGAVDRCADLFFLGGLTVFYSGVPLLQGLTIAALVGSNMVSYSSAQAELHGIPVPSGYMRRPERCAILIVGIGISGWTIPLLESHLGLAHAVGIPMIMGLLLIAVLGNYSAVIRLRAVSRALREREAIQVQAIGSPGEVPHAVR